jgi:glycosyltransferase involved in cell wall biosynthesis
VIPNPVPRATRSWSADACDRGSILFVGRFDSYKGADTMLAAFDAVARRRADARLTLVGPDVGVADANGIVRRFDDYARRELSEEARSRIDFTGRVPPSRVQELRARANVTVVASRAETFSYAIVEAMASGSPVISSRWKGSAEIVDDGVTGWLTPMDDAPALAERIEWVLDHPEEAAQVAAAGRELADRAFTIDAVGPQMERFYRETLRRTERP